MNSEYLKDLKLEYQANLQEMYKQYIFRQVKVTDDLSHSNHNQSNAGTARKIRKQIKDYNDLLINDMKHINSKYNLNDNKMPVIFELIYHSSHYTSIPLPSTLNTVSVCDNYEQFNKRVFILVHGFQGNNLDMKMIKNHIQSLYPNNYFLLSQSNEFMTEQDIQLSGENLANELKYFLQDM